MRIVWVKVGGLWPVDRGGRRRSFEIARALAARHEMIVLTTHDPSEPAPRPPDGIATREVISVPWRIARRGTPAFAAALARSWASDWPVDLWRCRVPALAREVARWTGPGGADVCVADFLAATPNLPARLRAPVVLFAHNVEHAIWRRIAGVEERPWRRALLAIEWRKVRRCEARAVARLRRTVAVSEADRAALAALAPGSDVRAVPTGVDPDVFRPNGATERPGSIVFVGAMDWYPNEDAVLRFVSKALPILRHENPSVSFTVVGRNPGPRVRALAPGVRVTGTVDDVRPFVAEASVVVVPLRIGGGTRLKIFEAMAMGKAVVSTSVGAEGLPIADGQHFVRADGDEAFARAVARLLRDLARRRAIGGRARRLVEERYGWATVARAFETHIEGVAHGR